MMPYPTFQAAIQCPQCGQRTNMKVEQVIDVGEEPAKREQLLRGRLNVLNCSRCGATGPVALPLVYHDPAHQLLLAFLPSEAQLTMEQEEKEIGRLTNLVLDNTPPAQRKGYMLTPIRAITYDGMIERIMEAEGISPDDLRKQAQKIQLVTRMAKVAYEDEKLDTLIEENRESLDYNFMLLVTMTLQQAAETHDEAMVERYGTLREKLVEKLELSPDDLPSLGVEGNIDDLIDALLETPATMLQGTVAANRPLLDYNFFMHLSQRAERSADPEEKTRLLELRKKLVDLTDEMDRLAREAMERAAQQLNEVLQAEDIDAALKGMYRELDEAFLVVLSANIEHARSQKREDIVDVLTRIYHRVVEMMEERLRPELRAVNQLLRMETAQERRARLEKELAIYNPAGFIEMIEAIAGDLEESGGAQPGVLERLYTIADEAREIAGSMDFTPPSHTLFEPERPASSGLLLTPEEERRRKASEGPGIILP